jgi:dipeptidyl aminopeptidase/acylaminoacyl peptidase
VGSARSLARALADDAHRDAKTPMLIVVGDNDARTPIAQSRELYTALRSLGVPVQLVHYPREGHGLREPRHRADALLRARAWFDRWMP